MSPSRGSGPLAPRHGELLCSSPETRTSWLLRALPALLGALVLAAGCDARPRFHIDGGLGPDSTPGHDALPGQDAGGEPFAGVTISGCEELDLTSETQTCRGTAPLLLAFSSLAPTDASSFRWEFGDSTPDASSPSTSHEYRLPGEYNVLLVVGGPFGSISPPYPTLVEVAPAPAGAYCSEDAQCAESLCLCETGDATGCPPILEGTCSSRCDGCPQDTVCADLTVGDATDTDGWRSQVCLPGCETSSDCPRPGFVCRELPSFDANLGRQWQPVCFPDVLADLGESCHDTLDQSDPALCYSGRCGHLGRFGLCIDGCLDAPCPSYAACVTFAGGPLAGEPVCLARCGPDHLCDQDPQLACEPPNGAGDLGFILLDPGEPQGHTYCAPRRCETSSDCPSSPCDTDAGGFCM